MKIENLIVGVRATIEINGTERGKYEKVHREIGIRGVEEYWECWGKRYECINWPLTGKIRHE